MTLIIPITSQSPTNQAIVNTTGGVLLATGGGYVAGPPVVTTAGSSDAVAAVYDGTSTSGTLLATFGLAAVGPVGMPNQGFAKGLFVEVTATTAGVLNINYTGNAA